METRFILITYWNFDFYGIFEPGDRPSKEDATNSGVEPTLVDYHCVFAGHSNFESTRNAKSYCR